MIKTMPDKAEITLELPGKFCSGTFERSSRFYAHLDGTGVSLLLDRPGEAAVGKSVLIHFHYELFADMLCELARSVSVMLPEMSHRHELREGAEAFLRALAAPNENASQMTWEEQEPVLQITQ